MLLPVFAPLALAAIVGGAPDTGHPEALYLDLAGGRCSGILVDTDRVLTAAHCVAGLEGFTDEFVAVFAESPDDATEAQRVAVSWFVVHPDDSDDFTPDLAVLGLAGIAPVPPVPWSAEPIDDGFIGQTVTLVGFGDTGPDQEGPPLRRAVSTVIDEVTGLALRWNSIGAGTCHGDSGGPVIADLGGGPVVIGVSSGGDPTCTGEGWGVRTDPWAEWIGSADPASGDDDDFVPGDDDDAADGADCGCAAVIGGRTGGLLAAAFGVSAAVRRRLTGSSASRPRGR